MLTTHKFQIRRATESDSKAIWEWRNDPLSRRMFVSQNEVSWDEHTHWFSQSLVNPNRYLFVGFLLTQERVGVCRFDVDATGKRAEVSINLNPAMRGKKYAAPFLSQAIHQLWETHSIELTAKVRKDNSASLKCFVRCGFVLEREDGEYRHYFLMM